MPIEPGRTITDADADAIAEAILARLAQRLARPYTEPSKTVTTAPDQAALGGAVDADGLRKMVGANFSDVTIWSLQKRGLITRIPGFRRRLFTVKSVRAFIDGRSGPR
jgi:hypothetical protein